jgi:hypothetical protein
MMKPVHDIVQHYHRWPGMYPIPPTNQEEEYTVRYSNHILKGLT